MTKGSRLVIAGASSNSGKTLITCALLALLKERGLKLQSFKCGPDYIDPLFHETILGVPSGNLDSYFAAPDTLKYLLDRESEDRDLAVIEGVMGYYDGLAGISTKGSTYDIGKITQSPVVLVVDGKGMSLSLLALLKGYLTFRKDHNIKGVILNRVSEGTYNLLKPLIEEELLLDVLGFLPVLPEAEFKSRHLGLVLPFEREDTQEKIRKVAQVLAETVDVDKLLEIGGEVVPLSYQVPLIEKGKPVRIGVSSDEAFCFCYKDNLELLERLGAELVFFSPLHDQVLPEVEGLLLYGGYPELYGEDLSNNKGMRESLLRALEGGLPCLAECGGFMYLLESLEGEEGVSYPLVGYFKGSSSRRKGLGRFGYIALSSSKDQWLLEGDTIKGHEFHYYDSKESGDDFTAKKPLRDTWWSCMQGTENVIAGFPHLYYYSNPKAVERFLDECRAYGEKR